MRNYGTQKYTVAEQVERKEDIKKEKVTLNNV